MLTYMSIYDAYMYIYFTYMSHICAFRMGSGIHRASLFNKFEIMSSSSVISTFNKLLNYSRTLLGRLN